jgi:predicted DNA-binding protein (MmcQ/YjbR family)
VASASQKGKKIGNQVGRKKLSGQVAQINIEWVRKYCLSLPNVSEHVQWEIDLVFKIGGKMFAVMPMEPARVWLSFKTSPEVFAELVERAGIIPAPYLARAMWVAMEEEGALPQAEVERLLRQARELVFAKLTKKMQAELNGEKVGNHKRLYHRGTEGTKGARRKRRGNRKN